jgi:hypothetical protein
MIGRLLHGGQAGLKIVRVAVGHRNHKGLIDGTIDLEKAEEIILNSDHQY